MINVLKKLPVDPFIDGGRDSIGVDEKSGDLWFVLSMGTAEDGRVRNG